MELRRGAVCPVCEEGALDEVRKDLDFEYKGEVRTISNQLIYECHTCGESLQNKKDRRTLEKLLTDSRRTIDGLLTSRQIRRIRKIFGMTQSDFAAALKVGEKNFARYESGQSMQGRTTDSLLRILERYPHAIRVLGVEWPTMELVRRVQASKGRKKNKATDFRSIETEDCKVACDFLKPTSNGY